MYTLYTFPTPNGHKASIMLEELGLPYQVHRIDLGSSENKRDPYLAISPIGKIPALVSEGDNGKPPHRLFGSGAILLHLAAESGKLLPGGELQRAEALSWLMFGISDLAPTAIDLFRFRVRAPEPLPYAIDLFKGEMIRCYDALEQRLSSQDMLAGEYSIADIACFPFINAAGLTTDRLFPRYPNLRRWHDAIAERPAVQKGMKVPGEVEG